MSHNIHWESGKCRNCGKKLKSSDALVKCRAHSPFKVIVAKSPSPKMRRKK